MNIQQISDLSDPILLPFRDLPHRSDENQFVVESVRLVERLIQSTYRVTSVVMDAGRTLECLKDLDEDIPVIQLSRDQIRELVGFRFHRGVLASAQRQPLPPIAELNANSFPPAAPKIAIGAFQITDKENLGSLMRTASAFGVKKFVLSDDTVDPFSRRVTRVSMGTVFQHQLFQMDHSENQIKELANSGFRIVATSLAKDSTAISEFNPDDRPVLLMVGNESDGLPKKLQQIANDRIRIPMDRGTDSLNVAVAAAILMYELTK